MNMACCLLVCSAQIKWLIRHGIIAAPGHEVPRVYQKGFGSRDQVPSRLRIISMSEFGTSSPNTFNWMLKSCSIFHCIVVFHLLYMIYLLIFVTIFSFVYGAFFPFHTFCYFLVSKNLFMSPLSCSLSRCIFIFSPFCLLLFTYRIISCQLAWPQLASPAPTVSPAWPQLPAWAKATTVFVFLSECLSECLSGVWCVY